MTFKDPVVDGNGGIVTRQIKSPGFVSGVSGWSINRDGSAEFNDAVFRGSIVIDSIGDAILFYNGVPAAGTLLLAISRQGGIDPYGNHYNPMITIDSALGSLAAIVFRDAATDVQTGIISSDTSGIIGISSFGLGGGTKEVFLNTGVTYAFRDTGMQIASGRPGLYYAYNYTWSALAVPVSTTTPIANPVAVTHHSDYPDGLAVATFTPPVAGYYDLNLAMNSPGMTTDRYVGIRVNSGLEADNAVAGRTFVSTSLLAQWLDPATDTATFEFAQTSGAAQNVTGKLKIARRL